jgi:hypothetical protein
MLWFWISLGVIIFIGIISFISLINRTSPKIIKPIEHYEAIRDEVTKHDAGIEDKDEEEDDEVEISSSGFNIVVTLIIGIIIAVSVIAPLLTNLTTQLNIAVNTTTDGVYGSYKTLNILNNNINIILLIGILIIPLFLIINFIGGRHNDI